MIAFRAAFAARRLSIGECAEYTKGLSLMIPALTKVLERGEEFAAISRHLIDMRTFAGDGRPLDIDNGECPGTAFYGKAESGERVGGFTGLGNCDDQCVLCSYKSA